MNKIACELAAVGALGMFVWWTWPAIPVAVLAAAVILVCGVGALSLLERVVTSAGKE